MISSLLYFQNEQMQQQCEYRCNVCKIVPLYHEDILAEYEEVLHRSKFHFKEETIQLVINAVKQYGIEVFPQPTGEIMVDMDDLVFY